jgi:hypothetical protein
VPAPLFKFQSKLNRQPALARGGGSGDDDGAGHFHQSLFYAKVAKEPIARDEIFSRK